MPSPRIEGPSGGSPSSRPGETPPEGVAPVDQLAGATLNLPRKSGKGPKVTPISRDKIPFLPDNGENLSLTQKILRFFDGTRKREQGSALEQQKATYQAILTEFEKLQFALLPQFQDQYASLEKTLRGLSEPSPKKSAEIQLFLKQLSEFREDNANQIKKIKDEEKSSGTILTERRADILNTYQENYFKLHAAILKDIGAGIPPGPAQLICDLLSANPAQRPTAKEALQRLGNLYPENFY